MAALGPDVNEETSEAPVEEGAPLWTVTFGDMMSLLLTFFILLFSMSELRMERFLLASQSLSAALGGTAPEPVPEPISLVPDSLGEPFPEGPPGSAGEAPDARGEAEPGPESELAGDTPSVESVVERLTEEYLNDLLRRLQDFVTRNDLGEVLSVDKGPSGVRVRVSAAALFEPGSAAVSEESRWLLDFFADLASEVRLPVIVSGHADNQPIQNAWFPSNWELSAARAAGVARELVARGHDPLLLRVESFGEHRPVASNDSMGGRALNRRIEFLYDRVDIMRTIEGWRRSLAGPDATAAEPESRRQENGRN